MFIMFMINAHDVYNIHNVHSVHNIHNVHSVHPVSSSIISQSTALVQLHTFLFLSLQLDDM